MVRELKHTDEEIKAFRVSMGLPAVEDGVQDFPRVGNSEDPKEKRAYKKRTPEENK